VKQHRLSFEIENERAFQFRKWADESVADSTSYEWNTNLECLSPLPAACLIFPIAGFLLSLDYRSG
jgi:hypothetical protein